MLMIRVLAVFSVFVCFPFAKESLAQDHFYRQVRLGSGSVTSLAVGPRETVEIVLPFGGSVVVAPDSSVKVEVGANGTPTLTMKSGLARFTSAQFPMSVKTEEANLELSGGSAIIERDRQKTRAHLLFGNVLTFAASA
ncbi:MAG: FecR domain-containing protein, partial [Bacteroidota bacterium]